MLRRILYADIDALDDYISIIDGYTYEEQEVTKNTSTNKEGKANIGGKRASVGGSLEKSIDETVSLNAKVTIASKLDKVIKYLKQNDDLKYYQNLDDEISKDIFRDDFLEVLVTPRFSKLQDILSAASNLKTMMNAIEPYVDGKIMDKKTEDAVNGLDQLSKSRNSNVLPCVFNFDDMNYPLIGKIDKNYLKASSDQFVSQVYMLCKVQRKIEKGQSILLDELFEDVKSLPMNRVQKRKLKDTDMSNPEEFKDKINGPGYVVIPIAIYQ